MENSLTLQAAFQRHWNSMDWSATYDFMLVFCSDYETLNNSEIKNDIYKIFPPLCT